MNKVVKICLVSIIIILLIFVFYLFNIKSYITGNYVQNTNDCKIGYDCVCIKESCICKFKKYWVENKITCQKNILNNEQIN
ncbi:MAG: hypothetical protein E7163_05090 [Firmicutes bacterium]|nr:hypothetical protein [Bacillota bacterium]